MEATGGRAHDIDGATEPYNRSARHARFSKTPTDLVATLDLPWNVYGFELCADLEWTWPRSICTHGRITDWARTCLWTGRERGMCVALEKPWLNRGQWGIERGLSLESFWMFQRMLPGRQSGHHADCFVDANLSASWSAAGTSAAIAKSLANRCSKHGADIQRCFARRFKPTARTLLGSCPAISE